MVNILENSTFNFILFLLNAICFIVGVVGHFWFNFYIGGVAMFLAFHNTIQAMDKEHQEYMKREYDRLINKKKV